MISFFGLSLINLHCLHIVTGGANSYFHRQRGSRVRMEAVTKHEFYDPVDFDLYAEQCNTGSETEEGANDSNNELDAADENEYVVEEVEETAEEEGQEPMSGFDLVNKLLKRP